MYPDGSFTYTPAYHYVGTDSFTYRVTDRIAESSRATVSFNVFNLPPVASEDGYLVLHDRTLRAPAPGVLAGDWDPDGDQLTAVLVAGPAQAAPEGFHFCADGSFADRPVSVWVGTDSFTYKATDGITESPAATVTIVAYNTAPQCAPYVEAIVLTEDTDLPANERLTTLGGAIGQLEAADPNGDTL